MARPTNRLTDTFCKKAKLKRGTYADGGGLYLQVSETGTKAWILRYAVGTKITKNGKVVAHAHNMGLGDFERVTLKDARKKAQAAHSLIVDGIDPIAERSARKAAQAAEQAKFTTFEECARGYVEAHRHKWKSAKHGAQWMTTLETYAFPTIGKLSVGAIGIAHVVKVLEPIWKTRAETARRVRARIEMVLDRASALKLRHGDNPARLTGELKELLPAQVRIVAHHEALPYSEMAAFMAKLRERDDVDALALEWTILTATRTGDVRDATWSEINLKEKMWTIPAGRVKGKLGKRKSDHTVPLCDRALAILADLPRSGGYVFPGGGTGGRLSEAAMSNMLASINDTGVTVHGFRSTFKDWCAEQTAYPGEMSELALSHTVSDKTEAAYRRGDMREKRHRMMQDWAAFCAGKSVGGDNVIAIGAHQ
jgi:integrase